MNKNIAKVVLKYIIALIIIAGIPNIMYVLMKISDPVIYIIATITGWFTICYSAGIRLILSNANWKEKIIGISILMFILPILGVIGFWFGFSIPIEYIEGALFSAMFGICIATGFELIMSKKFK